MESWDSCDFNYVNNAFINLNKSSTSHFTKLSLHDFTDLHVKLGFYGGTKEHRWKEGGMGRNNRFISITVFSESLEAKIEIIRKFWLIEQPHSAQLFR